MKKIATKKKSTQKSEDVLKIIELPSNNTDMEKYVDENRMEINKAVVDNIDFALKKRLSVVEIFSFKNSNFVVSVNRKDFKENLENLFEFSLNNEHFENCGRVKKVMDKVDKLNYFFGYKKTNNKYVKEKTFKK